MNRPLKKPRRGNNRLRVLIVDDSADVREKLALLLGALPGLVIVGQATDGATALEAVHQLSPDLITLDIRMPGKSGLEVLSELGRDASQRVIVLAALMDEEIKDRCLQLGARHVFDKTSSLDQFLDTVAALTLSQ